MGDVTVNWSYCVTLALLGVSGVAAWQEISWMGQVTAGFSTTFNCSSACSPNCTYMWYFLGRSLLGNTLTWTPDGRDSKVDLQCIVLRMPKAKVYHSMTSVLKIKNPLFVQPRPTKPFPTLNQSFDLVCDDSESDLLSDPPALVIWHKDGQKMMVDGSNASLHFDSLLPSDGGFYQCEASASGHKSVFSRGYRLSVDPWNVSISGPDVIYPGIFTIFNCVVSCNIDVDCMVTWHFRRGFPSGSQFSISGTELKWVSSTPGTFPNLTCVAENPAAGRSAEATKRVQVKDTPRSGSEPTQRNGLLIMIVLFGSSRLYLFYL